MHRCVQITIHMYEQIYTFVCRAASWNKEFWTQLWLVQEIMKFRLRIKFILRRLFCSIKHVSIFYYFYVAFQCAVDCFNHWVVLTSVVSYLSMLFSESVLWRTMLSDGIHQEGSRTTEFCAQLHWISVAFFFMPFPESVLWCASADGIH